jgi:hypothetical protein
MMSEGHVSILFRPIPAVLLTLAALLFLIPIFKKLNAFRVQVLERES